MEKNKVITLPDGTKIELLEEVNSKTKIDTKILSTYHTSPNLNPVELRQENVQEILTAMPHWMIRWGSILFFSLIVLILVITWIIRYPDVISAGVKIIDLNPKEEIFIEDQKKVGSVLIKTGDMVKSETKLAVIKHEGDYKDVLLLKSILDTIKINSDFFHFPFQNLPGLSLGTLQPKFAQFENSYFKYLANKEDIKRTRIQIRKHKVSTIEKGQLNGFHYFRQVIDDFQELKQSTSKWVDENMIASSINGTVEKISLNSEMNENIPFITLVPNDSSEYIAVMEVPSFNSGKIKIAQKVKLRLSNYLEADFGIIEGEVLKIEQSKTKENHYFLTIDLPNGLLTSYNFEIPFDYNLNGIGNIIIDNPRLIEQFIPMF